MNFADIETAWRSPQNRPNPAELEQQKMKLIADLQTRRRRTAIFIGVVFLLLCLITGKLALHLIWPRAGLDRIDLSREWGSLLVFALPWFAAFFFLREYRRHRKQHANYERSIAEGVRALLDENRLARNRVKVTAALHGLLLVLLPIVVYQLRAAGKAGDEILLPAFVGWPLIGSGILIGMLYGYRRKLLPRKLELEQLLKSYE
jgi:hypothetical protein